MELSVGNVSAYRPSFSGVNQNQAVPAEKPEKKPLSTGTKVLIGVGIAQLAAIAIAGIYLLAARGKSKALVQQVKRHATADVQDIAKKVRLENVKEFDADIVARNLRLDQHNEIQKSLSKIDWDAKPLSREEVLKLAAK